MHKLFQYPLKVNKWRALFSFWMNVHGFSIHCFGCKRIFWHCTVAGKNSGVCFSMWISRIMTIKWTSKLSWLDFSGEISSSTWTPHHHAAAGGNWSTFAASSATFVLIGKEMFTFFSVHLLVTGSCITRNDMKIKTTVSVVVFFSPRFASSTNFTH